MTRPTSIRKKIGLMLFSILLSLVALELFLRAIGYSYTPLSIEVIQNWSEWRYYHAFEDKHFTYDSDLIWRPRTDAPGFNAQGYRGKEISLEKAPGAYRIFALGDSNTLGWLGQGNWPGYLEEFLNEKEGRFTVVNAGVYGYSSFQGVRRFKEALPFQPDLVLISFGANDAMRVTISDAEFASSKVRETRLDTVLCKARTGQLVLSCSDKLLTRGKEDLVPRVGVEDYTNNLEEIIQIANERGIKVVLLTRPFITLPGESHHDLWWKNFAPDYNAATKEVGGRTGTLVIDVYAHFEGKKEYFSDESHFTKGGHREMARLVGEKIKPQ